MLWSGAAVNLDTSWVSGVGGGSKRSLLRSSNQPIITLCHFSLIMYNADTLSYLLTTTCTEFSSLNFSALHLGCYFNRTFAPHRSLIFKSFSSNSTVQKWPPTPSPFSFTLLRHHLHKIQQLMLIRWGQCLRVSFRFM